jgi:asparagine synthase (glutamine-hydrolysing)
MNGICGWLGGWYDAPAATSHLLAMLGQPRRANVATSDFLITPAAALAASGFAAGCDVFRDGELLVAIEGRPTGPAGHARRIAVRYREAGEKAVAEIGGAFALVILDTAQRTAILAIDRLGARPMVFAHVTDGLVFGGGADAVRRHPRVQATIDPQAIYEYVYFHVVPSPRTIYAGIRKLPPAHYLLYSGGSVRMVNYWNPGFVDAATGHNERALAEELRQTLRTAVRDADPGCAAGAFLSGGIDSSTVAGLRAELCDTPIRTYTIGFDAAGYDEIAYARIAAERFRLDSREYYVTRDDVARSIDVVANAYDEPFGNSSALPAYHCARLAREEGRSVLLAGDGGDELFAGNARYAKQSVFEHYRRVPAWLRKWAIEPVAFGLPQRLRVAPVRKLESYVRQALVPLPARLETWNLLHMRPLDEIFERSFLATVDVESPVRALTERWRDARTTSTLNRMLYLDWKFTLADNDLRKVNRMCEICDIEVRYPMLDDALVEFSARVPPSLKLRGTRLRHFYKNAMRGLLPDAILHKSKHGFGLPFGEWMRTTPALIAMAEESLRALQARGIVRREFIDRVLEEHRSTHAGFFGEMVWVLMMLERWWQAHALPAPETANQASAAAGRR